jgi:hypothetical protein
MRQVCRTLGQDGAVRGGLALLMTVLTLTACSPSPEDIAVCRKQFADYQQLLGENGNPGRKAFTPKMTARWDALDAEFGRLGKSATGDDCPGRFRSLRSDIGHLESVLYKIDDYDVARMIRHVEADLARDDALDRAASTDYVLISLLRTMRERGADAEKVLAPLVARVDASEPDSPQQAAAMVALYNVAASDAAFADFKEARESIADYELDEE